MNKLLDWLALSLTPGLGIRSWNKLLAVFDGPRQVLEADQNRIKKLVPGLRANIIAGINKEELRAAAEKELERAAGLGIEIITREQDAYPELLRNIDDPPILLYVKGNAALLQSGCIGVVGARAASVYGQRIAEDLSKRLCQRGLTVVSGLALGIDTAAHKGALQASGATLAVLGCGLDVVYPRQNGSLYEEIACRGALVSEYRLGALPEAFRFPARNRIISGLSLGVVVVEAARKSGSLITADFALEQGREVFAVPGRIDSCKSEGTHRLLQAGAKLVHTVEDILEEFSFPGGIHHASPLSCQPDCHAVLTEEEKGLFAYLDVYPQSIDEITRQSGMTVQKVSELLLMLELKGLVESLPGNQYQKRCPAAV
ncbi:MAG: DNA-processing protein DprA [Desulfobulbaceae bacterium]|nr:DNA-processing protein DprA [Desulfobulbaceae bacterium]